MGRGDDVGRRPYRDTDERDGALEAQYTLWCNEGAESWKDKPCCSSLLQHVAVHGPGLVAEYMTWVRDGRNLASQAFDSETLHRWEVERFGARAYTAAHCVLLHAVKVAVFGDAPKRRKPAPEPRLTPGLTDEQRKDRMLAALDKVAEAKAMPDAR